MCMSHEVETVTNVTLSTLGVITAVFGLHLHDIDLILSVALKIVSIVSFSFLIVMNFDKVVIQINKWFGR